MDTDSDILDSPQNPKFKPDYTLKLVYIELGFIGFSGLLGLIGFSSYLTPVFILSLSIYACVAPFLKPQFTKGKSLRIVLGIWNIVQIILVGLAALFMFQRWPKVTQLLIASFSSFAIYFMVLPFVESHKIKSIRFLSVSFFSFGLSIMSISVLFALNQEIIFESLRTRGAICVGISALIMLFQLANKKKKPVYYLFYLPRIIGLLIAWSIASYLL